MQVRDINTDEFEQLLAAGAEVIDVREQDEWEIVRVQGAKLIPMNELSGRLAEINWSKPVVFYCRSGARSGAMSMANASDERPIINLRGGVVALHRAKSASLTYGPAPLSGYL